MLHVYVTEDTFSRWTFWNLSNDLSLSYDSGVQYTQRNHKSPVDNNYNVFAFHSYARKWSSVQVKSLDLRDTLRHSSPDLLPEYPSVNEIN